VQRLRIDADLHLEARGRDIAIAERGRMTVSFIAI
jgi:hypothetical protein